MTRPTPRQTEPSANTVLGEMLKGMLLGCQVRAEHTGLITDRSGLRDCLGGQYVISTWSQSGNIDSRCALRALQPQHSRIFIVSALS